MVLAFDFLLGFCNNTLRFIYSLLSVLPTLLVNFQSKSLLTLLPPFCNFFRLLLMVQRTNSFSSVVSIKYSEIQYDWLMLRLHNWEHSSSSNLQPNSRASLPLVLFWVGVDSISSGKLKNLKFQVFASYCKIMNIALNHSKTWTGDDIKRTWKMIVTLGKSC